MAIKVKRLEFELIADSSLEGKRWFAYGIRDLTCYVIREITKQHYQWNAHNHPIPSQSEKTHAAAVAACQAHFDAMILGCIEEQT